MKPDQDLWRRLLAFDFDSEGHQGRFLSKLARDNGWHTPYARRVVEEYRRYAYLCCTAGHVVVPSEQVDQAWHQHLLDTEPYWDVFCRQVLRRPLHHRPSRGGIDDRRRHVELYQETLASYGEAFGHPPPPDIWPPADVRFGADLRHQRVRLEDYWLIPKRPVTSAAAGLLIVAGGAAIAGMAPRYAGLTSPLDFTGPTFLAFYGVLFLLALAAAIFLRRQLLDPTRHPSAGAFGRPGADDLDPYEAATLWKNTRLAINAAIAALERDGAIAIVAREEKGWLTSKSSYRAVRDGPLPPRAFPLEAAVYELVARRESGLPLNELHERLEPVARAMVNSLQERGLLLGPGTAGRRFLTVVPLLALAAFGVLKIFVGIARDRPVGWLVLLVILATLVAAYMLGTLRRTRRGWNAIKAARLRHPLRKGFSRREVSGGNDVAWLVGLYGIGVLTAGDFGTVQSALAADATRGGGAGASSSGGCGGGCGGGGGGSGGDGGGGCGGGGCGGCGG